MTELGNYNLIKQIGAGGFARTYLAEHKILKGVKACIKQNIDIDNINEKLLLSEAVVLADIHHYTLPSFRDFVRCPDGSYAIIMSFVEGKELYKIVKEDYPRGIDPEHVCWITQRLLNALHYLHNKGVIHGDVKPQNIIVKPKEHLAVLVDYGLSTVKPRKATSCPGYTPAFAAPEQTQGKPPIPETDLYGLGMTMIFALGGDHTNKTIPKSVPKEIREFFLNLVKYDPMSRPSEAINLVKPLSNIREKVFGRRMSGRNIKVK